MPQGLSGSWRSRFTAKTPSPPRRSWIEDGRSQMPVAGASRHSPSPVRPAPAAQPHPTGSFTAKPPSCQGDRGSSMVDGGSFTRWREARGSTRAPACSGARPRAPVAPQAMHRSPPQTKPSRRRRPTPEGKPYRQDARTPGYQGREEDCGSWMKTRTAPPITNIPISTAKEIVDREGKSAFLSSFFCLLPPVSCPLSLSLSIQRTPHTQSVHPHRHMQVDLRR